MRIFTFRVKGLWKVWDNDASLKRLGVVRVGQAELTWWLVTYRHKCATRELNPDTVTHPSTHRARRRLTSLIETNAISLYHYNLLHVTFMPVVTT